MAILHGGWFSQASESQRGGLLIWGEMWRRLEPSEGEIGIPAHPYAMNQAELLAFLGPLGLKLPEWVEAPKRGRKTTLENWTSRGLALPTEDDVPQLSAAPIAEWLLYPWKVQGLWLNPSEAFEFLNSLPLGALGEDSFLGGDVRFWSHAARWALDLLARSKFLPDLDRWEALLDSSTDQARLRHFVRQMPSVCRLYQIGEEIAIDLPIEPQDLLRDFLNQLIDSQVRKSVTTTRNSSLLQTWIQALGTKASTLSETESKTLSSALEIWKAPLQKDQEQFRACLKLIPPAESYQSWKVEYLLQAIDDPDFTVSAPIIWRNPVEQLNHAGRIIDRPQETLLMGLGLASRLYSLIEPSLQEARPQACLLDPTQAYDFIMNTVWRLQDSGIGAILPPSLANRSGLANRLGLRIKASTPTKQKKGKLGLQSLLNFEWELSIGGQSLTKREFDRLVAQNSPLVEINGEWVELRSQDIKSAQSFFAARKDQTTLSLEDALRISTGDTQTIEKLPVVSFEASGALQELVTTLTGTGTLEEIETPKEFRGELRPYQLRGVAWLQFLEKWGLGACLADDMGLGKTIELIAFILTLKQNKLLEQPILLICPTSVLGNWEREVKKFAPTLKAIVHHGDKRSQNQAFVKAAQSNNLIITSYTLVQRDLKTLQLVNWQGIVLDEAQNIKNAEAKQSQAVRELEAEFRIALTGTPVENRLTELWSILDFLNPGYLGQRNFFQRRFAIPIERYGDTTSLQTLRSLTQPFILRRLKTDRTIIQDLPEKQEMPVYCGLSAEQAALYQATVDRSLAEIEAADGIQRKGIILALLTKLKQICNHPALFNKEESSASNRSVKLQRLEEMLEEAVSEGDRALI